MAAFEAGDYSEAVGFWERLLALEPPGSEGSQMLATLIAEARTQGNLEVGEPPALDNNAGLGAITVSVSLPEEVTETEGVVFVVARPAGSEQRMPTAVARRGAKELPLSVTLDDSNSMAGQTLSTLSAVDVEVQLSPTGQPGRQNASWVAAQKGVILAPGGRGRPDPKSSRIEEFLLPTYSVAGPLPIHYMLCFFGAFTAPSMR